jgi:hypothetical protein
MAMFVNHKSDEGYEFTDFYPSKCPEVGPGWYVFGRNKEKYGLLDGTELGRYTMLVARPDTPLRKYKYYNGKCKRGWRTMAKAQYIADCMNNWHKLNAMPNGRVVILEEENVS